MSIEYATTFTWLMKEGPYDAQEASERGYRYDPGVVHRDAAELTPVAPEGTGWTMCGATATKLRLYWFWCREKQKARRKTSPEAGEEPGR